MSIDFLFDKFVLVTLDDSSGSSIEIKIERVLSQQPDDAQRHRLRNVKAGGLHLNHQQLIPAHCQDQASDESGTNGEPRKKPLCLCNFQQKPTSINLTPLAVKANVENIQVATNCDEPGCRELHIKVDGHVIRHGMTLKIRGIPQIWGGTFQVKLERASLVRSLDEESRIWSEYSDFVKSVLSGPWILSVKDLKALEGQDKRNAHKRRVKARRAYGHEKLWEDKRRQREQKIVEREAKADRRRAWQAQELDGNPLDRSRWVPQAQPFA